MPLPRPPHTHYHHHLPKVGALTPELQPSLAKQLASSIRSSAQVVQHEAGEALYVQVGGGWCSMRLVRPCMCR